MTYLGIAKGRTIELSEPLPFAEGQSIQVSIEPVSTGPPNGSAAAVRAAMRRPPHLGPAEVDDLERAIEAGKLPVRNEPLFDSHDAAR